MGSDLSAKKNIIRMLHELAIETSMKWKTKHIQISPIMKQEISSLALPLVVILAPASFGLLAWPVGLLARAVYP